MRFTLVGSLAVMTSLATGCAALDSDLQYRGSLPDVETNGVVLFEDGEAGHAAMFSTTCVVDPDGGVQEDVDVVGDDSEVVLDGSRDGDGSVVLARTRDELHVISSTLDFNGWAAADPTIGTFPVDGIVNAKLTNDGIAVATDCSMAWLGDDGLELDRVNFTDVGCTGMDPNFDVDAATGTGFVNVDGSILSITPDGAATFAEGDLLAWSASQSGLITADNGATSVNFVEADGNVRWSTDLGAPVLGVADLGARGLVAVMVERADGGKLVTVDATTGLIDRSFDLPDTAEMVVSANGQTIAMVLQDTVHYYNLK